MNRRVFLHAAGGALAAAWAASAASVTTRRWPPGALQGAGQEPVQASMQNPVCMAVYDPTLARGRALAREAARRGVSAFALGAQSGDDIGMLWHAQLARRLETGTEGPAVAHPVLCAFCALRASDRFVLERLAAPRGCIVLDMLDAPQT